MSARRLWPGRLCRIDGAGQRPLVTSRQSPWWRPPRCVALVTSGTQRRGFSHVHLGTPKSARTSVPLRQLDRRAHRSRGARNTERPTAIGTPIFVAPSSRTPSTTVHRTQQRFTGVAEWEPIPASETAHVGQVRTGQGKGRSPSTRTAATADEVSRSEDRARAAERDRHDSNEERPERCSGTSAGISPTKRHRLFETMGPPEFVLRGRSLLKSDSQRL